MADSSTGLNSLKPSPLSHIESHNMDNNLNSHQQQQQQQRKDRKKFSVIDDFASLYSSLGYHNNAHAPLGYFDPCPIPFASSSCGNPLGQMNGISNTQQQQQHQNNNITNNQSRSSNSTTDSMNLGLLFECVVISNNNNNNDNNNIIINNIDNIE